MEFEYLNYIRFYKIIHLAESNMPISFYIYVQIILVVGYPISLCTNNNNKKISTYIYV